MGGSESSLRMLGDEGTIPVITEETIPDASGT